MREEKTGEWGVERAGHSNVHVCDVWKAAGVHDAEEDVGVGFLAVPSFDREYISSR